MNMTIILLFTKLFISPKIDSSWMKNYDIVRPSGKVFIVKKYYYDTINIMRIDKKWKAGIVNKNGKIILPLNYDDVSLFSEGMAEVVKRSTCSSCWDNGECTTFYFEGDHGYVNENGMIVIPLKYSAVGEFHEGLAWVATEQSDGDISCMFINKSGSRAFNFNFHEAKRFQAGIAPITYRIKEKKYYNYIDHTGKLLVPSKFSFLEPYQSHIIRTFRRGGLYGFLDTTGIEKIKLTYTSVDIQRKYNWQYLRRVGNINKFGYINETNGVIEIPIIYDSLFFASKNALWAKKESKWGLISKSNETLIPFQFDQVEAFYENLAAVSIGGQHGYVDTIGHFKIEPIYEETHYFNEGLGVFRQNDKYGFLDNTGNPVIPAKYDYVSAFNNGAAKVRWSFIYATIDKWDHWINWSLNRTSRWFILIISVLGCVVSYFLLKKNRNPIL